MLFLHRMAQAETAYFHLKIITTEGIQTYDALNKTQKQFAQ